MAGWTILDNYNMNQADGDAVNYAASGGSTIKLALLTSSFTPGAQDFWDDVSALEVSGTNYTAGGIALSSKTLAVAGNNTVFGAGTVGPIAQSGSGFSNARYAVLYKDTGTPATSTLIAYADLGANVGNEAGPLSFTFTGGEIIQWSK